MYGRILLVYLMTYALITSCATVPVDRRKSDKKDDTSIELFRNVKLQIQDTTIKLSWSLKDLFTSNEVTARQNNDDGGKKGTIFKRVRTMIMMIPFAMQMMSLPGALASIKASLLRSIFVGKLALAMIIYNAIRSSLVKEVVVVHKIPPQHHDHYYHPDFDNEDSSNSWWGR